MDTKQIARFFALASKLGPAVLWNELDWTVATEGPKPHYSHGTYFSGTEIADIIRTMSGEEKSKGAVETLTKIEAFMCKYQHVQV